MMLSTVTAMRITLERAAVIDAFERATCPKLRGYALAYRMAIASGQDPDEAWEDNVSGVGESV